MPGHNHEVTLASFVTKVYTEYFQGNGAILSDDKNQSSCLVKPRYTIIMAPALKNIYPLAQALPRLLPSKKHFLNIVSPDLCGMFESSQKLVGYTVNIYQMPLYNAWLPP